MRFLLYTAIPFQLHHLALPVPLYPDINKKEILPPLFCQFISSQGKESVAPVWL